MIYIYIDIDVQSNDASEDEYEQDYEQDDFEDQVRLYTCILRIVYVSDWVRVGWWRCEGIQ